MYKKYSEAKPEVGDIQKKPTLESMKQTKKKASREHLRG